MGSVTIRLIRDEHAAISAVLRSISAARGVFTMKFSHYEQVPSNVAQPIIAAHKAAHSGVATV